MFQKLGLDLLVGWFRWSRAASQMVMSLGLMAVSRCCSSRLGSGSFDFVAAFGEKRDRGISGGVVSGGDGEEGVAVRAQVLRQHKRASSAGSSMWSPFSVSAAGQSAMIRLIVPSRLSPSCEPRECLAA